MSKKNIPKSILRSKELLKDLTTRESKLFKERPDIDRENSLNLEEVGKQFNITRDRIRKNKEKALRKLRNRGDDNTEPA